jgi:hypothetical protein
MTYSCLKEDLLHDENARGFPPRTHSVANHLVKPDVGEHWYRPFWEHGFNIGRPLRMNYSLLQTRPTRPNLLVVVLT